MVNLSDNGSDGIALFYVKNGILYPIGMSNEEANLLDVGISALLPNKLKVIFDMPLGKVMELGGK